MPARARKTPRGEKDFPVKRPWKWLRQLRDERGAAPIVPAIGSGWNAQAVGAVFGWRDLLAEIRKATKLAFKLPPPELTTGNTTLIWERMLFDLASAEQRHPHQVEAKLQTVVAKTLRKFYPVGGLTKAFADRFLAVGFEDVLSFNFDQGLHAPDSTWQPDEDRLDPVLHHCRVNARTRVWYPHGSVCEPRSIQLGLRAYGTLIKDLESARQLYKATEKELLGDPPPPNPSLDRLREVWALHRAKAQSWIAAAMNAPLVFAGLSLGREEWPLWWFLNQRARNHARRGLCWEIPTFVILHRREAEALETPARLVNLTILPVDSYQEGWDRLFEALV